MDPTLHLGPIASAMPVNRLPRSSPAIATGPRMLSFAMAIRNRPLDPLVMVRYRYDGKLAAMMTQIQLVFPQKPAAVPG